MRKHYDFSGGIRGKYYYLFERGYDIRIHHKNGDEIIVMRVIRAKDAVNAGISVAAIGNNTVFVVNNADLNLIQT